jgi:hypothetical protein
MNLTSKPGVQFREVVPAERYFLEVCPSAGALLPPPGPCLRIGEPKKALRASRAEQGEKGVFAKKSESCLLPDRHDKVAP